MRTSFLVICFLTISLNIFNQNICYLPDKVEFLHVNNIRAAIKNRGTNFSNLVNSGFKVPYKSSATPSTIYTTSLWFGGYDSNDNLYTNTIFYKTGDVCGYIPGPFIYGIDEKNYEFANNWNMIFKVTSEEINAHTKDNQDNKIDMPIQSIFGWPGKGNPFFKLINGFDLFEDTHAGFQEISGHKNGIYEPQYGEYPKVEGIDDNTIPGAIFWCVYRGGIISAGNDGYEGLKLQIEQTAWAMSCNDDILSNTLFTRYLVKNISKAPYYNFRFGLWTDPDLGCLDDDFVGSFPELNSFYIYNMDNEDGPYCQNGIKTYGIDPPVQVITFLGENGLDGFSLDKIYNSYQNQKAYYYLLDGKLSDGSPITYGGNGNNPGSTDTVFYMFPDDPDDPNGWSMVTAGIPAGDKRALGISRLEQNPDFVFKPQQSVQFDIGYTFFRKEGFNNLENVNFARQNIPILQDFYDNGFPQCSAPVCNCECVWSGDTDKNGIVNYSDYINILKNLDKSGPTRNKPVAWIGSEVLDWTPGINTELNPKYADANGDGSIDTIDLSVVDDLFGQKNLCFVAPENYCDEGDDLVFSYNFSGDNVIQLYKIIYSDLILKNESNLLGLEYEIYYDGQIFNKFSEKNEISWQDNTIKTLYYNKTSGTDKTIKHIIQFNDNKSNKKLFYQNNNKIFNLNLQVINIPKEYPTPYTQIKVCNAKAYYGDGSFKYLPAQMINLKLPATVIITDIDDTVNSHSGPEIVISPNQANTEIIISFGKEISGDISIDIYDISGKWISSKKIDGHDQRIDLSEFSTGIYFLKIKNEKFVKTKKVIICR